MGQGLVHKINRDRSFPINFEGMRHAPENELGVVFLFSKVARRLGFLEVDVIQQHFPDCWAFHRTNSGVARTWIEFEFRSHSFKTHLKKLKGLKSRKGIVICWEHDWKQCEKYAKVIELKTALNLGRQVWVQSTLPKYQTGLDGTPRCRKKDWHWTVSGKARPGDLVLMYRAGEKREARFYEVDENLLQSIRNIFVVKSVPKPARKWRYSAEVAQITKLENPLRFEMMRQDPILKAAPFISAQMQGQPNLTPYWYRIYDLILQLNPYRNVRKALRPFRPEVI
jgi:hypothetical protein